MEHEDRHADIDRRSFLNAAGKLAVGAPAVGAIFEMMRPTHAWAQHLRSLEQQLRAAEREQLADPRAPLHPLRVYAELVQVPRPLGGDHQRPVVLADLHHLTRRVRQAAHRGVPLVP